MVNIVNRLRSISSSRLVQSVIGSRLENISTDLAVVKEKANLEKYPTEDPYVLFRTNGFIHVSVVDYAVYRAFNEGETVELSYVLGKDNFYKFKDVKKLS